MTTARRVVAWTNTCRSTASACTSPNCTWATTGDRMLGALAGQMREAGKTS